MPCTSMEWEKSAFSARDTVETIQALRGQEKRYTCPAYLHFSDNEAADNNENHAEITNENRRTLVEWCYRVVDHFNLPRNVVALTMNFVDRFCGKHHREMSKEALKLVTTSALQLSLKIQRGSQVDSVRSRTFSAAIHVLPKLARGHYSETLFAKFEMILLKNLGFFVNPPLASDYVPDLIRLLPLAGFDISEAARRRIETHAMFLTELAVVEYALIPAPHSTIALAAVLNAIRSLSGPCESSVFEDGVLTKEQANILSTLLLSLIVGDGEDTAGVAKAQDILWSCFEVQQKVILDEIASKEDQLRQSPSCVADFKY